MIGTARVALAPFSDGRPLRRWLWLDADGREARSVGKVELLIR